MKNEAVSYQIDTASNISLVLASSSLLIVTVFIHGGHFNEEKSMISRQFACVADCLQSFMWTQKVQNRDFCILAKIDFSVRTANKIRLNY